MFIHEKKIGKSTFGLGVINFGVGQKKILLRKRDLARVFLHLVEKKIQFEKNKIK